MVRTSGLQRLFDSMTNPPSSNNLKADRLYRKERTMNPLWVLAIPLALVIIGMVLNSFGLSFDEPESSTEQDPARRLEAERRSYHRFFAEQRRRALTRQKRVGQYGWLVLIAFVGAYWWMYADTVAKAAGWNQIATLQTMPVAEGKDLVLSLTLRDGSNVKYLIKAPPAGSAPEAAQEGFSKDAVPTWEVSGLGTALSSGAQALPLGVALKISN
jgi:hypothetical protein